MPPPLVEAIRVRWLEPHPQLDAVVEMHDIERTDIVRGLHDAFAEAEPDREIPQVLRRSHHHGIGAAIVGQGKRGLLGNRAPATACATLAPDLAIDGANGGVHVGYSAASTERAMRLEWRACSS